MRTVVQVNQMSNYIDNPSSENPNKISLKCFVLFPKLYWFGSKAKSCLQYQIFITWYVFLLQPNILFHWVRILTLFHKMKKKLSFSHSVVNVLSVCVFMQSSYKRHMDRTWNCGMSTNHSHVDYCPYRCCCYHILFIVNAGNLWEQ